MNPLQFEQYLTRRGIGRKLYGVASMAAASAIFATTVGVASVSELPDLGGGSYSRALGINDRGDVVGSSHIVTFERHSTAWLMSGAPSDLGTLGGAMSDAKAISPNGVIVGTSDLPDGSNHAALWSAAGSAPVDLGTLGGFNSSANAINAAGDVVGFSYLAGDEYGHATLWSAATRRPLDLGALPGSYYSVASAINTSGDIVGTSYDVSGVPQAILWPVATRALVQLKSLGGRRSEALGINDLGDIVGLSQNAAGLTRPVLWPAVGRVPVDLGTLGGTWGAAVAINKLGDVVGYSATVADERHATIWRASSAAPTSSCRSSSASRSRNNGKRSMKKPGKVTVTSVASAPSGARVAFDLGTLVGGTASQATGINAMGQVVGFGENASFEDRAMLWRLDASVPPAGTPSNGQDQQGNHENEGEEEGDC